MSNNEYDRPIYKIGAITPTTSKKKGRPKKDDRDLRDYCVAILSPSGKFAYLNRMNCYVKSPSNLWKGTLEEAYLKAKLQSYLNRHEKGEFGTMPYEGGMPFTEEWKKI